MQSIDFQNGHHLDITTMNFIQEAYTKPILAMAAAAKADSYIVSGVELTENGAIATWSNGYIVLNGEPMEFRGGTYNGNDDNAECYVVRREETLYNINANGNSVPALTRVYATLGAREDGAIYAGTLSECRLKTIVTATVESGLINTDSSLLVLTDDLAKHFGAGSVDLATPRWRTNGYTVAINGVFVTHDWSEDPAENAFGTIPGWTHGAVSGIPCELSMNYSNGTPAVVKGHARIQENGRVLLEFRYNNLYPNAITFDGTPVLIL